MGAAIAVLAASAVADSLINGTSSDDAASRESAVQRLSAIPTRIGNWIAENESTAISDKEREVAGISGYVRRTYVNSRTGYTVDLTILCGPSGPISVHPPTACFEGFGYTLASGPTSVQITDGDSENRQKFNKSTFRQKDAAVPEFVRVFWGWSTDGMWQAPDNPRFEFRGHSWLYKIYATDRWFEDNGSTPRPQAETFLEEALPVIGSALQGSPESDAAVSAPREATHAQTRRRL